MVHSLRTLGDGPPASEVISGLEPAAGGADARQHFLVAARRRVAEEHVADAFDLERLRQGQAFEERELIPREAFANPREQLGRRLALSISLDEFAIGVPTQPEHPIAERAQALDRLRRPRARCDVPAHDDRVSVIQL